MPPRQDLTQHLRQLGPPEQATARHPASLPIYALISPSPLLLAEALSSLRSALGGTPTAGLAESFTANEAGAVDAALHASRSLPLWGRAPGVPCFIVLRGLHQLSAADTAQLAAYMQRPAPHSVLCLVGERLDARTKFGKALAASGALFEIPLPRPQDVVSWLQQRAKRRHLDLPSDAARCLVDLAGTDLDLLIQSLEKVALYVGDAGPLSVEAVTEVLARTREERIFSFTDALGKRRFAESILRLQHLLQDGQSPLMILSMVARQLRQLLQVKTAPPRLGKSALATRLSVRPFVIDTLIEQAGRFAATELLDGLSAASRADLSLKSSRLGGELVLGRLVERICSECPNN
jgi:DNA polymerase-3 subunit delta